MRRRSTEGPMRVVTCILVVLTLSACESNDPWEALDVKADGVTINAERAITGPWLVVKWTLRPGSQGEACLVVRPTEIRPAAATPTTAQRCIDNAVQTFGTDSWGYYRHNACWIKPPTGTCNRTVDALPVGTPTRWDT